MMFLHNWIPCKHEGRRRMLIICWQNIPPIVEKGNTIADAILLLAWNHNMCLLSSRQSMKTRKSSMFPNEGCGLQDQVFLKTQSIIMVVIVNGNNNMVITIIGRNPTKVGTSLTKVGSTQPRLAVAQPGLAITLAKLVVTSVGLVVA